VILFFTLSRYFFIDKQYFKKKLKKMINKSSGEKTLKIEYLSIDWESSERERRVEEDD
jgi:predicted PurR-regulated permease PerM